MHTAVNGNQMCKKKDKVCTILHFDRGTLFILYSNYTEVMYNFDQKKWMSLTDGGTFV